MMRLLPGFIRNLPMPAKIGGGVVLGVVAYESAGATRAVAGVGAAVLLGSAAADAGALGRHGYGMLAGDAAGAARSDPGTEAQRNPSGWRRADLEWFRHHGTEAIHAERAGDHAKAAQHHDDAARFAAAKPRLAAYHAKQAARLRGAAGDGPTRNPADRQAFGTGLYEHGDPLRRAMADGHRVPMGVYMAAEKARAQGAKVHFMDEGGGMWSVTVAAPPDVPITHAHGLRYRTMPAAIRTTLRDAGFIDPGPSRYLKDDAGLSLAGWTFQGE